MSGGAAGAAAGTISLMFAGPDAVLDAHRPVFEAIAGNIFHVGTKPGQGQAMKLLNNFLSATALASTSEALAFGRAHGLDLAMMVDVLNVSSGRNSATVDKFPRRVLTGTYRRRLPHRPDGQGRPAVPRDGAARPAPPDTVGRSVSRCGSGPTRPCPAATSPRSGSTSPAIPRPWPVPTNPCHDRAMSTTQHDRTTVKALAERYRNWGKWGPDDEVGTVNYISPQKIVEAAGLVRKGKVFSLALPLDGNGPMTGAYGRVNPIHVMLQDGGDVASGSQDHFPELRYTDDAVYLVLQCATQWDALAHIYHEGKMYNGYGTEAVNSLGANKNSITNVKDKMVSRGVLLDIAHLKGKRWLDVSEPIGKDELEAAAEKEGVEVGEGDIVLVRTGRLGLVRERGSWGDEYSGGPAPGLAISASEFLCERKVAAVATDTWGIEVLPNETPDVFQPLHIILLVNAGIHIGEMFDLEDLAADCADGRRVGVPVRRPAADRHRLGGLGHQPTGHQVAVTRLGRLRLGAPTGSPWPCRPRWCRRTPRARRCGRRGPRTPSSTGCRSRRRSPSPSP